VFESIAEAGQPSPSVITQYTNYELYVEDCR